MQNTLQQKNITLLTMEKLLSTFRWGFPEFRGNNCYILEEFAYIQITGEYCVNWSE